MVLLFCYACYKCGDVVIVCSWCNVVIVFFFQAEDGIRDLVRSRGLGDVYKRQIRALEFVSVFRYNSTKLPGRKLPALFI